MSRPACCHAHGLVMHNEKSGRISNFEPTVKRNGFEATSFVGLGSRNVWGSGGRPAVWLAHAQSAAGSRDDQRRRCLTPRSPVTFEIRFTSSKGITSRDQNCRRQCHKGRRERPTPLLAAASSSRNVHAGSSLSSDSFYLKNEIL